LSSAGGPSARAIALQLTLLAASPGLVAPTDSATDLGVSAAAGWVSAHEAMATATATRAAVKESNKSDA